MTTGDADDGGATRTIGVAVAVPEPYGSELQAWRRSFGDPLADAIPTHITLLSPTVVPEDRLPFAEQHLIRVAAAGHPFQVHLRGTATFRPVSPVVFVAVVEGIAGCEVLAATVRSGPLMRELPFPYHPHVTVAHDLPDDVLERAFTELAGYEARFDVTAFGLYEHGADGVWRPQRDFVLGGPLPGPEPVGGVGLPG
ncbi:MAG TPA: 2'-5' RNA ligase family protein [Jiangellales bacterium]|nr:2'-5' RNA ligase family protein [Jiangellales bacterium]